MKTIREDHALSLWLNLLGVLGISVLLGTAFYYQLAFSQLPCPLCLLQRVGLLAIGLAFLFNVRLGVSNIHYAMAIVAALVTGAIAARQVLLHIAPGNAGYGDLFLGLHFYTWALIASMVSILAVAFMMLMLDDGVVAKTPGRDNRPPRYLSETVTVAFVWLIAGNLVSTVLECGAGQCADDPVSYQLLGR